MTRTTILVPLEYEKIRSGGRMDHKGEVSTEGGPFLIVDANAARAWRGDEQEYFAVCRALEARGNGGGVTWPVGGLTAVAWEPEGEGIADVFVRPDGGLLIVRGWFDGDWTAATREAASLPFTDARMVGSIEAPSGMLAVLWSPEDGRAIRDKDLRGHGGRPSGRLAIDGSTLLVRVAHPRFRCLADRVSTADGEAVRCALEPA